MQNTKNFEYSLLINDEFLSTYREIKQIIYKITLNKIFKQTNYTNKIMRKLVNNISKQIYFLFKKYFRKNV